MPLGNEQNGAGSLELSDIFYTSNQKKGHVRVELNDSGFSLQRGGGSATEAGAGKVQQISMNNIIGSRCMRLKKRSRLGGGGGCVCSSSSSKSATRITDQKSIEAAAADSDTDDGDASAYLYVFAYVLKKNLRNIVRRERTVLTLRFRSFDTFEENMQEADRWYKTLRWHKKKRPRPSETIHSSSAVASGSAAASSSNGASGGGSNSKRLLVFVNPKSGKGKGREIFNQTVAPLLNEAEVPFDLHVTREANYARDFVRTMPAHLWGGGVVAVGGDGLFFELLNGLLQRRDWQTAVRNIPLGVVPCGSGNGLARSIAHSYNEPYEPKPVLSASLGIVHCANGGHSTPMDVVRVELKNRILYSFLSVGWGLISDVDIESERLRALGYQRFTIWTLYRLVSLRTYGGRIAYALKDDVTPEMCTGSRGGGAPRAPVPLQHSRSCNTNLSNVDHSYNRCFQSVECLGDSDFDDVLSVEPSLNQASFRSRGSWLSVGSRRSTYYSISESVYHSVVEDNSDQSTHTLCAAPLDGAVPNASERATEATASGPSSTLPALHEPIPDSWIVEEGEFVMVHATYQSYLSSDCFFAPASQLNDGTIFLVIIRGGIGRIPLFNFLVNMSSGTHLPTKNNEFIKVVPVTAFRIEPHEPNGIITVDGECVEFGPLQGEILPGLANVLTPTVVQC